MTKECVILAYSGGLDTSCILKWLLDKDYKVICYIGDVGQDEDFVVVKAKALKIGAHDVVIDDLKVTFIEDYIFPAIQAGLLYESRYLLGTALARPCISNGLIKCYQQHGAQYISHGATGKGNDQVRFELSCYSLCPSLRVIAPWRDPEFTLKFQGRKDLLAFAAQNGIPVSATPSAPWSTDANLMHISYESGILENPAIQGPSDLYAMTSNVEETPDEPYFLEIIFKSGIPSSLALKNNERIENVLNMYMTLNQIGGIHGIGRIDIVENRFIGLKSRGIYESPGAHILHIAHKDLEIFCLDKEIYRIKQNLSEKLSECVYNGFWFSPEADYLRNCIAIAQEMVSGTVKLKIFKGNVFVLGRYSDISLYNEDLVSMDRHADFTPTDATGFINIHAIRLKEYYRYKNQRNKHHRTKIDKSLKNCQM